MACFSGPSSLHTALLRGQAQAKEASGRGEAAADASSCKGTRARGEERPACWMISIFSFERLRSTPVCNIFFQCQMAQIGFFDIFFFSVAIGPVTVQWARIKSIVFLAHSCNTNICSFFVCAQSMRRWNIDFHNEPRCQKYSMYLLRQTRMFANSGPAGVLLNHTSFWLKKNASEVPEKIFSHIVHACS